MKNNVINLLQKEFVTPVDFNATEKDLLIQQRYEADLFNWFIYGLKRKDSQITREVLEIVALYQDSVYRLDLPEDDFRRFILDYTKFGALLERSEEGERLEPRELTYDFNPFYGTPEEMLFKFKEIKQLNPAIQPMKELFEGMAEFTQQVTIACCMEKVEELRCVVRVYLLAWLEEFWTLLAANETDYLNSYFGFSCPVTQMTNCICDLTYDSNFDGCFDALFAFLTHCVGKYDLKAPEDNWLEGIINNAIWHEDWHIFQVAVAYAKSIHKEITIWDR